MPESNKKLIQLSELWTPFKLQILQNTLKPYMYQDGNVHRLHLLQMNLDLILQITLQIQYQIKLTNYLKDYFYKIEYKIKLDPKWPLNNLNKPLESIISLLSLLMLMQDLEE